MTPREIVAALRAGDRPEITKPTVPEVMPLLEAYYGIPCFGLGGITHLYMEDPNYEQLTAEWCLARALEPTDERYNMQHDYDVFIAWVMVHTSPTQRGKCSQRIGWHYDDRYGEAPFWVAADVFMADHPTKVDAP